MNGVEKIEAEYVRIIGELEVGQTNPIERRDWTVPDGVVLTWRDVQDIVGVLRARELAAGELVVALEAVRGIVEPYTHRDTGEVPPA